MTTTFEEELRKFAESLGPSEDYVKSGKSAVNIVIERIKTKNHSVGIDRVIPSGSIAKNTSLSESDFDVVLLINDITPPYGLILKNIESFLKKENFGNDGIELNDIRNTKFSIQFRVNFLRSLSDPGFEVDLLVAPNFTKDCGGSNVAEAQKSTVLREIDLDPRKYYELSSALAESQVNFMKLQDSLTHSAVRLAKFWFKTMNLGPCRSGVKGTLELLAVHAAQRCKKRQNITSAFRVFLIKVQGLSTSKICFNSETGKCVRRVEKKLRSRNSPLLVEIPREFHSKSQFVLEPANPYNDISENIFSQPELYTNLKLAAKTTLKKYEAALRAFPHGFSGDAKYFFENLF